MDQFGQPPEPAATSMDGPLMLPLASSSSSSASSSSASSSSASSSSASSSSSSSAGEHGRGHRRRAGRVGGWGPVSVLVLLASLSSGCLAFAPHGSHHHLVGLRRAVGPAAGPSGRTALPALPSAGQRVVGAPRGRAFGSRQGRRMEMALGLFKGKRMPVGAGVSVSLDKRVIPVGVWPESLSPPRVLFGLTAALLLLLLVGKLPFMGAVNNAIRAFCDKHNIELYDKITYRYRLLKGRIERIKDGICRRWEQWNPREVSILPSTAFPVPLTLLERTNIGGAFMKHRFAFPGPTQVMDLDLGQQVSLIGSTPDARVMKAHFIPLSDRREPGVLEIVSEKNDPDDPAVRILDTLAIGESIQCTPGARLTNRHPGPINKLLLVVSKLGVVPALQFLKALLPNSGGYSVDYANVVWVNERQDQYVLHEELQSLFYKYNAKLDVFTVAERDLFMGDLSANQQFRVSIPTFTADTLAIVAGPEYFVTKAADYLKKSGYSEDVIVTL